VAVAEALAGEDVSGIAAVGPGDAGLAAGPHAVHATTDTASTAREIRWEVFMVKPLS